MAQRTPKYYDGTNATSKQLKDLLPQALADIGRKTGNEAEAVYQMWMALLEEKMGPMTEPVSLIDGVLTIKVKSATLYSLLCQHEKARLLKRLQEKFPIRNIYFRIG